MRVGGCATIECEKIQNYHSMKYEMAATLIRNERYILVLKLGDSTHRYPFICPLTLY